MFDASSRVIVTNSLVTLQIAQVKQLWYNDVVSKIRPEA